MIRRPPRSTRVRSSAASDVYKRQTPGRGDALFSRSDLGPQLDGLVQCLCEANIVRSRQLTNARVNVQPRFDRQTHGGIQPASADSDQALCSRQSQAGVSDLDLGAVSYTHLRAHETVLDLVCR